MPAPIRLGGRGAVINLKLCTMIEPIRFEDLPSMHFAGLRQHHAFDGIAQTVAAQWRLFNQDMRPRMLAMGVSDGAVSYGLACGVGPLGLEYMCGQQVPNFDAVPSGVGRLIAPAHKYAVFHHSGHVAQIGQTWQAIMNDWLVQSAWRSAHLPDFERYDQRYSASTGEGGFDIYVSVISA